MTTPTQLFTLLDACFDAQNEATALWHSQESRSRRQSPPDASASPETLLALVRAQHCGISGSGTLRTRPAAAT